MEFFHSFSDLGIKGIKPEDQLEAEAKVVFSEEIVNKTVLDIGAWDGWFSFKAESLGAAAVTACDWFCWGGPGWGTKEPFDYIRQKRGSKVKDLECDIPDLDPDQHGQFDIVLLLGVLYHVTDMFSILRKAQAMTKNHLVLESQTMYGKAPSARFWKNASLANDPTNFWTPTIPCIYDMLEEIGFKRFKSYLTPNTKIGGVYKLVTSPIVGNTLQFFTSKYIPVRHIIHAWKE